MAAGNKARLSLLLLWAVVASLVAGSSAGIYHIVGAGKGWRMAPNRTYYAEWVRTRNISIGDKLMFLYRSGVYNIVEVPTKELFEGCSMRNITTRYQNGPTIIELNRPGPSFYFCGVGKHCEEGQKLAINVSPHPTPPRLEEQDDDVPASGATGLAVSTLGFLATAVACLLASAASLLTIL